MAEISDADIDGLSPQIWKAFDIYDKYYQKLEKYPGQYCPDTNFLKYIPNSELFVYYFIIFGLILGFGVIPCVFLVVSQIFMSSLSLPLWYIGVLGVYILFGTFVAMFAVTNYFYASMGCAAWNNMILMERRTRLDLALEDRPDPRTEDNFATGLQLLVYWMLVANLFMPLLFTAAGLDPYPYFLVKWIPLKYYNTLDVRLLLFLVRWGLVTVISLEACRKMVLSVLVMSGAMRVTNDYVDSLTQQMNLDKCIRRTNEGHVILNMASGVIDPATLSFLSAAFFATAAFNYATIKLYSILPGYIYWVCPLFSIAIPLILGSALPQAIQLHEETADAIEKWKVHSLSYPNFKYHLRRVKALRPLAIHLGIMDYRFFKLKASTRGTFYYATLDWTINFCMGVDTKYFEDNRSFKI